MELAIFATGSINIIKMPTPLKVIYKFNTIPNQNSNNSLLRPRKTEA